MLDFRIIWYIEFDKPQCVRGVYIGNEAGGDVNFSNYYLIDLSTETQNNIYVSIYIIN